MNYEELMKAYLTLELYQKETIIATLYRDMDVPEQLTRTTYSHSGPWIVSYAARTDTERLVVLLTKARIGGM